MDKEINQIEFRRTTLNLILAIIVTTLIVGGGSYMWASHKESELNKEIANLQNEVLTIKQQIKNYQPTHEGTSQYDSQDFSSKYDKYKLQTQYGRDVDQKIIRLNKQTGEEEVVVASIKQVLPELQAKPNLLLSVFASPNNSNVVIFKSVFSDTDYPAGVLYSFNTVNGRFTKMKVNDVYDGFFGGFALSPNQTKFVWAPDAKDESGKAQAMYLIDLVADKYSVVVGLSGNETFNAGFYAMSFHFEINWVNDSKVKYAVFNQSKKGQGFDPYSDAARKSILIGYRELSL